MQKYRALFMRHLRAICGSPVHLTRESNEALLVRAGVDCPLYTLVSQTAGRHRITAAQEVFKVQPPALAELWSQVLASIRPGDQGQDSSPAQQQHRMTHADLTQELHSDSPPLPVIASLPDEATAPVTSPTTLEHPQVLQVAGKTSTVAMSPDRHTPPADVVPALNNIDTAAGATQPNDPAPITHPPPTNAQLDAPAPPTADSPAAFAHADFQCPVCAYRAENTSALRYHMNVKHGLSERQMAFESIESFRFEDHAFAGMPTCKHCMRSFTGVPQLRNHIVAQVCPKLHGVTQPAKAPVPQPALPSASDVNCVPLRDRPATLHSLKQGGWRELAGSAGFKQTALEHCPLCHLWVANASGQVKKHMTQKHKDLASIIKQVIADCRADTTDITSPCQLCNREWKGAKIRHRESCTVLFAAAYWKPFLLASLRRHMTTKTPLMEFEEVFTDAFQGANKRSSPGPLEERPSQQPKGKGRGKHEDRGHQTRGRYRSFRPLGARSPAEDQGLEGFGSNLGYMTQDWQPQSAPWRSNYPNYQVQELQQQVDQMSRLLHRHELEIMHLRVDSGFVLHLGAGTRGIIRTLVAASAEYANKKMKEPRMNLTLKQTMLLTVFRTLKDRLAKMEETPDLLAHVRKLGWHHPTDSQWLHLRWSQEREQLIPEEPQRMFPHAALSSHLDSILEILEEDKVLHQFNATRRFNDQTDSTVMFFIRVSLQEQKAQLLFQRLLALCGLGCLTFLARHISLFESLEGEGGGVWGEF